MLHLRPQSPQDSRLADVEVDVIQLDADEDATLRESMAPPSCGRFPHRLGLLTTSLS